jgi:hypothetical protein
VVHAHAHVLRTLKYVSGELGVKVPALDDTRSARLNGEEEAAVFELYSTDQGC